MQKLSSRKIEKNATILFSSLGCKLNKYEIEMMRSRAEQLGLTPLLEQDSADVVVINTCSVTNQASKDSRKRIRKYRKLNPQAYIIATGCYAQTDPEEVRELGIDLLLNNFEKEKFFEIIREDILGDSPKTVPDSNLLSSVQFQSRPFLKIQDGCNAFCSYCIIPRARGRSRSLSYRTVLSQVKELSQTYPEIVLSGVNLGQYEDEHHDFFSLLQEIVKIPTVSKIRISSVEPLDLHDEMLHFMVEHPRICNHLHISLQGAQDQLLKDMRRKYSVEYYLSRLELIKKKNPHFCIGTDVITGFPGESDEMFEQGLSNLQKMPLDYFHVFTFSSRDKTVAQKLPGHLDGPTKKERNRILTNLSRQKKKNFLSSNLNRVTKAVVERNAPAPGFCKALTGNYIPVIFEADASIYGLREVQLKIEEVREEQVFGVLTNSETDPR